MIVALLAALSSSPQLTKPASTALVALGEALQDTATAPELDAFLGGTLKEEAQLRLAALQGLLVRQSRHHAAYVLTDAS